MKKKRQANFELLRIVAMLMVIALHYLVKGGIALPLNEVHTAVNATAWLVEAACIMAVNVYVLISGYFLVESSWKLSRLIELAVQVLFYSLGVPLVCLWLDIGGVRGWNGYDWLVAVLPLQMEHYWFATAYVVLYLLVPVLSAGVKHMSRKQLQVTIGLLLLFYTAGKSLSPAQLSTDNFGYDFGWFLCLFLIAAYIRLHGIAFYSSGKKSVGIYVACVLGIWGISGVCGILTSRGLPLRYYMDMTYSYNYILTLIGAVSLFYSFYYLRLRQERAAAVVCCLAPYTFGVYLLHENIAVRELWQSWLGAGVSAGSFHFLWSMGIAVIAVFLAGVMTDAVRAWCFRKIAGIFRKGK